MRDLGWISALIILICWLGYAHYVNVKLCLLAGAILNREAQYDVWRKCRMQEADGEWLRLENYVGTGE